MKTSISAVITVKDEEARIARCLEHLHWVDEIVVVDNRSVDSTVTICRRFTDKVYSCDSPFTGIRVNEGIQRASGDWILNIDADEVITDELKQEIQSIVAADDRRFDAYYLPVRHFFMGRWLLHGGWTPSYIKRLYRRGKARYTQSDHHVQVTVEGKEGYCAARLLHYGPFTIDAQIRKMNFYTTNSARAGYGRRKASWFNLVMKPPLVFIKRFIVLRGFLDGFPGFVIAVLMSFYCFVEEAKIKELDVQGGERI